MDGLACLVLSDNASSRYASKRPHRNRNGTCAQCTSQDPRILGSCHARSNAVHHIVHCMAGAVFSANQRSTVFPFLPARTCEPLCGGYACPKVLALSVFFVFFNCSMLRGRNSPYDGRLYACQLHSALRPAMLDAQPWLRRDCRRPYLPPYLVKMQYMGTSGPQHVL